MNWYLEIDMQHGTTEWDVLKEILLLTFSFEDGFECIDEALQEIKAAIFRMPEELITWVQLDQSTHLRHALKCYNVTTDEGKDDPRNINIHESEGKYKFVGLQGEFPDISKPLKTKQVNVGLEAQLKFTNIGDYWDKDTVDKALELLREYQDLFPTNFSDLKGILRDMGVMKIYLKPNAKPNAKPVKQWPQPLNPKNKEKVREQLDKMFAAIIIEAVEESNQVCPMVLQDKKIWVKFVYAQT